jgi:NADH:ubiquinone oxidoreductase subunit 5 (subunit L)/multisubunit Na+/H+ antiporter MnhA subunit
MTTRVGDVFMLLGIVFLYSATGTLSYREIFTEEVLHTLAAVPTGIFGMTAAGLMIASLHRRWKSAQFLHVCCRMPWKDRPR